MKPLAAAFKSGGYDFELVKRDGMIAIYKKHKPGHTRDHFETVRIETSKDRIINGIHLAASERFPRNEAWGSLGFSYSTEEEARAKFLELCNETKVD